MSIQNTLSSWEQLFEIAQKNTSARRVRRVGQSPSTAPIPSSLQKLPPDTTPPVLLYRDTNSWCPFCERVWFALEEHVLDTLPALVPIVTNCGHSSSYLGYLAVLVSLAEC
jgi:thiol-disulfide isomerase/thioredoxin